MVLQSNDSDYKATFLDFDVKINNLHCTIKIYDKRDDFDFDIVNFPHLDSDIPQSPSYSGGSFPFGKSGDSPFYFPDREKNVKIFPVREIK